MTKNTYDVVVIGGGPGGYVAAIRASQLGLKAAVIERDKLGGVCLNWGCIPTKALLRSAEVYHLMKNASDFGLKAEGISFDIEAIVKRSRKVSESLSGGIGFLMKKNKIDVIAGEACLIDSTTISVKSTKETQTIKAKNIILATGARARTLPGIEPDGDVIWTAKEAMVPKTMPKSLLVIGSGAIGIEFASFYNTLGADVTVVEMLDRILPAEDAEIAALAAKSFKAQGMKLLTGAKIEKVEKSRKNAKVTVTTADGKTQTYTVDVVICAVGIVGNVENIGLEKLGIKVDRAHVDVNQWCQTNVKNIYAIGDLVGPPWLAHKASHEGAMVAERIAGHVDIHPLDTSKIPGCTYCHPQVASVGLTEEKAKEAGYKIKIGRFPFTGNGKAIALGDTTGLIKTIFDEKTGELLGAHMVGTEVTELIQGYTVARTMEATEADLMGTIFPHPTLSEMMHESVLDAFDRALHI